MPRYVITEWESRYEVDDKGSSYKDGKAKRSGPLEYIRLKVHGYSIGLGWRKLIAEAGRREAPGVFGIFCKLLEIAGDAKREERGYLDDTPETPIHFLLDLDEKQVAAAIKTLCKIGWIRQDGHGKEESTKEERTNSTQHNTTQPSGILPEVSGTSGKSTPVKTQFLEFIRLTDEEYAKLVDKFGKDDADAKIQELNNGIGSHGYKYKSHYHTILAWASKHTKDRQANSAIVPGETPEELLARLEAKGLIYEVKS
jgi:hypothetical protein